MSDDCGHLDEAMAELDGLKRAAEAFGNHSTFAEALDILARAFTMLQRVKERALEEANNGCPLCAVFVVKCFFAKLPTTNPVAARSVGGPGYVLCELSEDLRRRLDEQSL